MEIEVLFVELLAKKARENNTIDLNAYAIGLSEMSKAISKTHSDDKKALLLAFSDFLKTGKNTQFIYTKWVDEFLANECSVDSSYGWVLIDNNLPIEEQNLPPVEQDVLVYDGFAIYISNRLDEEGIVWDESVYRLDKVTHWMFLPEKP